MENGLKIAEQIACLAYVRKVPDSNSDEMIVSMVHLQYTRRTRIVYLHASCVWFCTLYMSVCTYK